MSSLRVWARLVGAEQAVVERVSYDAAAEAVVVRVREYARARRRCGRCGVPAPLYDRGRGVERRWRALDLGTTRAFVQAQVVRVSCRRHGPTVAAVSWARHGSGHTLAFDETVAWLATHTSKSAAAGLMRIAWRSVGAIIARVIADRERQVPDRLDELRRIGIDEVSYRKGHKYLTVVVDHDSGRLIFAAEGRKKETLAKFFDLLGPERCTRIALVSADGADWIADMVALRLPKAKLCMDPFHVVAWATDALDAVRRQVWRQARKDGQKGIAEGMARARFALWKNPEDLTSRQQAKLAHIAKTNIPLYRAYLLKEQLRAVFAPGFVRLRSLTRSWV